MASVKGIDITFEQISRASIKHGSLLTSNPDLSFHVGAAEKLPFPSHQFTKIYSVEAAQHFISLRDFAKECFRTLKPKGKVVVTTFFAVDEVSLQALKQLMPINIGAVDSVKTIEEALDAFQRAGFFTTEVKKIGQNVFPFFDAWLAQQKTQDGGRLWTHAWHEGLLEYYVLSFEKP